MRQGDALLVIDVQNDFCAGGSLEVPGGDEVVPVLNEYARRFHAAGLPVIATRDWHPPQTRHFVTGGGTWPPHCVQGTRGAEFHPDLRLPEGTVIVSAGMDPNEDGYSAFEGVTEDGRALADLLRELGVRRVFIGGLATDYCVRASALDARRAGLEVVVLTDAVRAVNLQPDDGVRALAEMRAAGATEATLDTPLSAVAS
jgi:nicotinamidase/pyrazinamidase